MGHNRVTETLLAFCQQFIDVKEIYEHKINHGLLGQYYFICQHVTDMEQNKCLFKNIFSTCLFSNIFKLWGQQQQNVKPQSMTTIFGVLLF